MKGLSNESSGVHKRRGEGGMQNICRDQNNFGLYPVQESRKYSRRKRDTGIDWRREGDGALVRGASRLSITES